MIQKSEKVISIISAYEVFIQAYSRLQQAVAGSRVLRLKDIPYIHFGELIENAFYEFLVCGKAPREAADIILENFAACPHWLTIAAPQVEVVWDALTPAGYEPHDVEYLMTLKVKKTMEESGIWAVRHLSTLEEAGEINDLRNKQVLTAGQLNDTKIQTYYIRQAEAIACYGVLVYDTEGRYYIANIYTRPDCRKQGMAAAIMQKMCTDARKNNYDLAVLLSSQAGHNLYRQLGFIDLSPVVILFYPGIA